MSDSNLKQRTAKGLMWGGIGNGAFQLLNLVFGIFLARLLSPADYGVVGALTVFTMVVGLLAESGFTLALVNKKRVTELDLNSVFWFTVVASSVMYIVLFSISPLIAQFYHMPAMKPLARFLFVTCLFGGMATTPIAILFRDLKVKERTQGMLVAVLVSGTVGVICAANGMGYWGIAMQTVTYSACYTTLMWIKSGWHPRFEFDRRAIMSMLPFSMKQLATTMFTNLNNNFFAMLLARFYGMRPTGFYTQGSKWVTMGANVITSTVNGVGQPVFRQAGDDKERLCRIFRKILRFTVFISFPAMGGLAIVAPQLITIAITDKWIESVPVMQILCVWGAFMPVSMLYGNLFNAINKPGVYMWNTISLGILQLVCVVCSCRYGLNVMLEVYVTVNILWFFVWQYFTKRSIGLRFRDVARDVLPYLFVSVAVVGTAQLVTASIGNVWLSLIAKIIIAVVLYSAVMWKVDSEMFREAMDFIRKRKVNKSA